MIRKNDQDIASVYTVEKKALGAGTYGTVVSCKHIKTE